MTDRTPEQKVLDAYWQEPTESHRSGIAMSLRAAVNEVVPEQEPAGLSASREECLAGIVRAEIRREFLALATKVAGPAERQPF